MEKYFGNQMKRVAILLAGGSGERFWPVSRKSRPKQLLALNSEKTLIEEAVERITSFISPQDIFVFTNEITLQPIRNVLRNIPPENIVAEPYKKNTAPALAFAGSFLLAKYGKELSPDEISVGVFTSDQRIEPLVGFQKTVELAFGFVENNPKIATIGIVPTRPDTAFGYIEVPVNFKEANESILPVVQFKEKPDVETARFYVDSGRFFWNSGMFFWRLDTFLSQLEKYLPEIYNKVSSLVELLKDKTEIPFSGSIPEIENIYITFPDISIDYALMEKTRDIVVVKSYFDWDDIGSWDALDRTKPHDANRNVNLGNNILLDTQNSIVVNESTNGNIKVCCLGLSDLVVVVADDAVLVCHKAQVQNVKKCVEAIKQEENSSKWL